MTHGGGVLNFGLDRGERHKGPKIGACKTDWRQIWGLVKLIFLTKCCFQNWLLDQIETSWIGFWAIFRIRNWKLGRTLWFLVKMVVLWNWKMLKRSLVERLREREKGVFPAAYPHNPFEGKYPLPWGSYEWAGTSFTSQISEHRFYYWLFSDLP